MITPERKAIFDLMEVGKEYTPSQIAEALGKKRTTVNRVMLKMHQAGMLRQSKYGLYCRTGAEQGIPVEMVRNAPCVYLLKCNGLYKIGRSSDPVRRIKELQTAMPHEVIIAHIIRTNEPRALEAELHQRYTKKRLRGEWFALDMFDVDEICSIEGDDHA